MVVLLSSMNGHPKGYWFNVRKYFVQGAKYNITMIRGSTYQIIVPKNARILTYITSIVGTWWGEQKLIQNMTTSGNNKIYTFTSQNATIEIIFVIER